MKPSIAHRLTNGQKKMLTHSRISPPAMDPIDAKESLLMVKDAFGTTPFFLIYGTLLGAVRDRAFIAWDRDIDLGCFEIDMEDVYLAIVKLLSEGFEVTRTWKEDTYFQMRRKEIYCDFAVMTRAAKDRWHWGGRFYEKPDWFSSLKELPFMGTSFLVPEKSEEFLEQHYGDWKTPNPECKHAKLFRRKR